MSYDASFEGARYRSPALLASLVTLALAPYVAAAAFRVWVLWQALGPAQARVPGDTPPESLELLAGAYQTAGVLKMVALILLGIVPFCLWTWRVASNARAFGAGDVSPAWTVGSYFVPFANVIAPLLALRKVWLASAPSTGEGGRPWTPRFVYAWWFAWLAAGPLVAMTDARADFVISPAGSVAFMRLGMFASAVDLAAVALMLAVVWSLTLRQHRRAAPAVPRAATVYGAVPQV